LASTDLRASCLFDEFPYIKDGLLMFGLNSNISYSVTINYLFFQLVLLLFWAINSIIPRESKIRKILNNVVVFVVVAGLINVFGVFGTVMFGQVYCHLKLAA
jgi:hypothetical protein